MALTPDNYPPGSVAHYYVVWSRGHLRGSTTFDFAHPIIYADQVEHMAGEIRTDLDKMSQGTGGVLIENYVLLRIDFPKVLNPSRIVTPR